MPGGLTKDPDIFQRALDIVFATYKCHNFVVYLDDNILFQTDMESHLQHVEEILSALANYHIKITLNKCEFVTQNVRYFGHIIEWGKFSIDDTTFKELKKKPRHEISMNCVPFLVYVTGVEVSFEVTKM